MLVLSRKVGESIRIDRDIVITITHVHGKRVKVGIEAPLEKTVRREELVEAEPSWELTESNC